MSLGVREYPSVDPAVVTVRTDYVGANADIIESQITEPLEEAINSVEGVKTMSSISTDGRSTITVEFNPEIDLNNAANDVRDKVSQAVRNLPPDTDPPVVQKADADAEFILSITVQSNERSMLELSEIGNNVFKERLQTVPGVSQVRIWGEKKYAMRLKLDPAKMLAYGISTVDLRTALEGQNVELPSGRIEGDKTELTVRTLGRINTPEAFNNMVIANRDGKLVRLRDVGFAEIGAENERSLLRGNGVIPMIGIAMQPQPGSNYIEIVDEAFKRVDQIKKELPDDIYLNVALDTTTSIRKAIKEVQETIFIAFVLVLLIIFFFLRSWKSTLIPVVVIPIALIGTFAVLYLVGYSINVLTLLGLVLATGLVVDDAIVVMENIYAKIEKGESPIQAAYNGSREVFFAVIATSISLVCVFLPIFFMEGLTGRLFREFALVLTAAIVLSTFVSLSLTPMMSSKLLRKSSRNGKLMTTFKRVVEILTAIYERTLVSFMNKRWLAWPAVFAVGAMIWLVGSQLPSELAPLEDKSRLRISANAPEGTSYEAMDAYQKKIMSVLDTLPEKEFLLGVTAPSFGSATSVNSSFVRITLKQPGERERTQAEIAREVSRMLKQFTFAETYVIQEPTISASRGAGNSLPVQIVLQAPDIKRLKDAIPRFMERAQNDPAFDVVTIDLKFNKPEYVVEILRDKALEMGVNVRDIAQTLQTFLSEQRLGYFVQDGKQYYVIAQAEKTGRDEPKDLTKIAVRNTDGQMVTLDNLITMKLESRPPSLLRYNRYVSATVSASTAEGYTVGQGIDHMQKIAAEVLDESFSTSLTGSSSDYSESSSSVLWIFIFALVLVFLTLAGQFESFRDPLTIMFTVPLALAGALISLYLFGHTLNIFSQIGIIVLIGIVTKNGILIVEFANQKRDQGMSLKKAATEAAAQRFRPILMTSLATILGALPIALALGDASTSRIPMGIAIIGGLIFSLLLTLYVIPGIYTYIASNKSRIAKHENEG